MAAASSRPRPGKHFPRRRLVEAALHKKAGDEEGQDAVADDPRQSGPVEPAVALEAAGETHRQRLAGGALVVAGDDRPGRILDGGVDCPDLMLLDDILAKGGGHDPDQPVLELGRELDPAHRRLLEPVEAAAARDHQLHRLGGDAVVGIADEVEQEFLALLLRAILPEAMLLDAADEHGREVGVAQHLRPFEDRQRDRHVGGGQSGMERLMAFETGGEAETLIVLDRADEAGKEAGGGQALPFGQAGLVGQQKVGGGDGKTLSRRGQQEPRGVALSFPPAGSRLGHCFVLGTQG